MNKNPAYTRPRETFGTPQERNAAARRLRDAVRSRSKRYVVRLQWRKDLTPGADPQNWRNWRTFAVVPILFYSEAEAWDYMKMVDIFKNTGRKPSATVEAVRVSKCTRKATL